MLHRKGKRFLLKILICAFAITTVVMVTPLDEMVSYITRSDWRWLFLALFLQVLLRLMTAIRMYWLGQLQKLTLGFHRYLQIIFATSFYGLFLPGGLAGGAVTFVKYRQYGAGAALSLINIVANKGLTVAAGALLTVSAWSYEFFPGADWIILLFLALCLIAPLMLRWSIRVCVWLGNSLTRVFRKRFAGFVLRLKHLIGHMQALVQLKWLMLIALLLAAMSQHIVAIASMLTYAVSIDIDITPMALCWVYGVIFLLAQLPISFANIGVREVSMVLLLQPYGISAAEATAWSILMYSGPLLCALIGGLLEALTSFPPTRRTAA